MRPSYRHVGWRAYSRTQVGAHCGGATWRQPLVRLFRIYSLREPLRLPGGRMHLVDRVTQSRSARRPLRRGPDPALRPDIHPDDWFLTCHFVDDQVMPGTLMFECCLHTLRILLMRRGWVGEHSEVVFEPVPGVASQLKCRGQVTARTKTVCYEVTIKERGYRPQPYVIGDALMIADGKPVVEIRNLSLQLTGLTRERLRQIWAAKPSQNLSRMPPLSPVLRGEGSGVRGFSPPKASPLTPTPLPRVQGRGASGPVTQTRPALYGTEQILAFSNGKPSEAFGEPYRIFRLGTGDCPATWSALPVSGSRGRRAG